MPPGMQHQLTLLPQMSQMVRPPQQLMQQALINQQMMRPTMGLPPGNTIKPLELFYHQIFRIHGRNRVKMT